MTLTAAAPASTIEPTESNAIAVASCLRTIINGTIF